MKNDTDNDPTVARHEDMVERDGRGRPCMGRATKKSPEREWVPLTDAAIIERVTHAYQAKCRRQGWVFVRPERFLISGTTVVMIVGRTEVGRYRLTKSGGLDWGHPVSDSGLGNLHGPARPTTRRERLQNAAWGLNRPLPLGWCDDGDLLP